MTTIRQIERTWSSKQYKRLFRDLMATRAEATFPLDLDDSPAAAAAMALIRMDELGQGHLPFYRQLVRAIIVAQSDDGGWGDLETTALCLRALLCGQGGGAAVARGIEFLALMQKPGGIWPKVPLRRMPEDAATSAFVLFQLGDQAAFQAGVAFLDAVLWFHANEPSLDEASRSLWLRAGLRCRASGLARPAAFTSMHVGL